MMRIVGTILVWISLGINLWLMLRNRRIHKELCWFLDEAERLYHEVLERKNGN